MATGTTAGMLVAVLATLAGALGLGLWAAMAAFVYIDATSRNVPTAHWWALGTLLLGPFAFVAYLIDRPKAARTPCPFCGQTILYSDPFCPYCGREVGGAGDS